MSKLQTYYNILEHINKIEQMRCFGAIGFRNLIHLDIFYLIKTTPNIIFFSLLDSDWLKSVPINP